MERGLAIEARHLPRIYAMPYELPEGPPPEIATKKTKAEKKAEFRKSKKEAKKAALLRKRVKE